jgi:mono/diheme cytochrome c family protein
VSGGDRRAWPWPRLAIAAGIAFAACARPLPDAESPGARAYAAQCGMCHRPYPPGVLTSAMWDIQVARMDEMRRRRGMPPLGDTERRLILEYLHAHAG